MGGSRRRLKKSLPKVRVGMGPLKRKKIEKTRLPLELAETRPDMQKRLGTSADWNEERTLTKNYEANRLVQNPNLGFGRNKTDEPLKSAEERHAAQEETYSDDDELRAGCNLPRHSGQAPPPKLTSTQTTIIKALLSKHKDNVEAMVMDTKLNKMQHSAGQLKKLIESYNHWQPMGDKARHQFRGPQKPYKRL